MLLSNISSWPNQSFNRIFSLLNIRPKPGMPLKITSNKAAKIDIKAKSLNRGNIYI